MCDSAEAETYYFSDLSGDDSRTSMEAQDPSTPWKTLNKLNSFFKNLNPGDSVLFKSDEIFHGSINVTKSGSLTSPIVLSSYGAGSKPVIDGFITLSNWISDGNGVYECYNPSLGSSVNMVTLNNIEQGMGRYPNIDAANKGYLTFESHSANVSITDNQLQSTPNWTNAELVIRSVRWALERRKIISHTGGTLTYSPLQYSPADKFGYFIQNDIKTLDQFGEWYYDPSIKKMYMYFGLNSPGLYSVKASAVDTLFNMFNLDNIVIDGIAFEGANMRALNFYSVDVGITSVKNCDIRFSGVDGLVTGISKNMIIDKNTVSNVNNCGIFLSASGWYSLTNNIVKRISLIAGMGTTGANNSMAIRVNAQNSLIQGNVVDSVGFTGIRFTGDSVLIKNNFVQHYCMNLDDGGGINTGSTTQAPSFGRRITHNVVLNGLGALEGTASIAGATNGIYIDDNSSGVLVDSNTVVNNNFNGILFHNVFSSYVTGNTVYNSSGSQLRLIHNNPQSNLRNLAINDNILIAKTATQFTFYAQTDASDPISNLWGSIDSNYHARPLLQTTVIKAIQSNYNQNLNIADWYALSSFDQHSSICPKTFASTINPDDSIRFEYNATNSVKTINLDKVYIDVKKNQYSGSVDLQPFSSLILLPVPIAPMVNITNPLDSSNFLPSSDIIITATAADADGTVSKVDFYNGNTFLGTTNTSPYTYTWLNVVSGDYMLTAKATDNDSITTTSTPVNITVNQPPIVSITNPVNDTTFAATANLIISATASDADGNVSKVEFYNGNILLGAVTTSPYTFTWPNVPSGNYTLTAKATDNGSLATTSSSINIYANAPPVISILDPLNDASYSAPATITINVAATDADGTISKVDFYNGTTLLGTVSTSPYIFVWANVPSGNYFISAKATDNGSLAATSPAINVTINEPPAVSITSPINNAAYTSPATIIINANATDVDGTISKVDFYNGTTLLATVSGSPYTFSWANVPSGSYFLTVKATDNGSLSTTSSIANILVNTPPSVTIINPLSNTTFAAPAIITIDVNAFDADGTVSKVDFYSGGVFLGSDNTSPYSIIWSNVASGSYSITAQATDNGGLVTTSTQVMISVFTPNIPPTVSLSNPSNNATFPAPATVTITATAADADGTISKVDFYNGTTLLNTDNTTPFSFTWTNVLSGSYSLTAIATDNGSVATTSSTINIAVNQLPAVSIINPLNNATFTAPATVIINAAATDADGTISKVDFYNGATLLGTDISSPFSFTWTNVLPGNYSLTAKATDNGSLINTSVAVAIFVNAANIPPSVSISSPANNAIFASPATVTINATAADADGTVSKVDFYNGSTLLGTDDSSPYSFTWSNVVAGNYSITAKATDNGAIVTTSSVTNVLVNSAPSVSITGPTNNAMFNTPATITINASATDPGGSVTKVDFYSGTTLLATDNTSPYSYKWINVPTGKYSLIAKATDNSSLITTSAVITVSVNAAPTVNITSPLNNNTFPSPATITINATAADGDGTVSKVDFYKGATLLGTDNTSPYSYTWSNVAAGSYTLTAKATDNNSLSTTSAGVLISVNAAPTVSITSPVKSTIFTAPASITIKANAADQGGSVSKVNFYNGTTLIGTDNTSPYSITWTNVPSGNYSLNATATDNTLLVTTSAAVAIAVNGAPSVSLTSPANNSLFTPPATIVINATATDPGGSVSKVDFYNGTTKLGTDNTSPYSYTWSGVASGNYTLIAKATDNSLKVTSSSTIAISVNKAPTVSISNPPNNANYAAPANIMLIATAADVGGSISKVDFYNGTTLLGSDNTSPYSFNWNNVPIGTYTVTAKATDNLGLSATSAPLSVIITQSITYVSPNDNASSGFKRYRLEIKLSKDRE